MQDIDNVLIPGYDGGDAQLKGLEELLGSAEYDGAFVSLNPYGHAPYLSPRKIVEQIVAWIVDRKSPGKKLRLIGFSMGGQTAVRVDERVAQLGFGALVAKVVAIDPPWDGHSIVGWQTYATRGAGHLPPVTYRYLKLPAQGATVATMMRGFRPSKSRDLSHIHVITNGGNMDVINSDEAIKAWRINLPSSTQFHALQWRHRHSHLSPDVPPGATAWERQKRKRAKDDLRITLKKVLGRLQYKV